MASIQERAGYYTEAFNNYQKAAENNFASAQYNLGVLYERGCGTIQDAERALYWYLKAAEQGHLDAQFNAGNCYQNGIGTSINLEQARHWFTRAAEQGDQEAAYRLRQL